MARGRSIVTRARLETLAAALLLTALIALTLAAAASAHFTSGCRKAPCKRHTVKPFKPTLQAIRRCETRGLRGPARWRYDGLHGGAYQFNPGTWRATGSRYAGAHLAPRLEQSYRAVVWASRIGWAWASTAGWPICGRGAA